MEDLNVPKSSGHFTYRADLDKNSLMQGDVIARSEEIDNVLKEVHPHFYHHPKNRYFMVVTQSCDLVLGRKGEFCKAPYISIAPVRPLAEIVRRQVADLSETEISSELPILSSKAKGNLSMFLNRLFNNNEAGYFYLESLGTTLEEDCCAMLNLSIAIKAPLHYKKCLDAKILELDQAFQAKLGWLVGQMYSRVGTTDWDPAQLSQKTAEVLKGAAIWVPDDKMQPLRAALKDGDTDGVVTEKKVADVIKQLPSKKEVIIGRITNIVEEAAGTDLNAAAQKIIRRIQSDPVLASLIPK